MVSVEQEKGTDMTRLFSALCLAALCSCSSAGPYVTNISSDGDNGIVVEKCSVHMNAFMGTVSNENCTTANIKLRK
jgi:type IV secretion system protein VirB7